MSDHLSFLKTFFADVYQATDAAAARAALERYVRPDCRIAGLEGVADGQVAFRAFFDLLDRAFRDIRVEVEECMSDGDRCAFRATVHFTAHNNLKSTTQGGGIVRIVNGQLVEAWNSWDWLSVFEHIGLQEKNVFQHSLQRLAEMPVRA